MSFMKARIFPPLHHHQHLTVPGTVLLVTVSIRLSHRRSRAGRSNRKHNLEEGVHCGASVSHRSRQAKDGRCEGGSSNKSLTKRSIEEEDRTGCLTTAQMTLKLCNSFFFSHAVMEPRLSQQSTTELHCQP
jgi:hypothetical protein